MKLALALLLSTICFPVTVMAAGRVPDFDLREILYWAIKLVIVGIIFGLILWGVREAPFIPASLKVAITWILWVLLGLAVIYWLLTFL